jgi:transcriptional regulator with XRE-family HTH domain
VSTPFNIFFGGVHMFDERLKELRLSRHLTQRQIFSAIELSERNYQSLEYGKIKPSYDTLLKLCRYFNVSSDWLLGLSEDKTIHSPTISPSDEEATMINPFTGLSC